MIVRGGGEKQSLILCDRNMAFLTGFLPASLRKTKHPTTEYRECDRLTSPFSEPPQTQLEHDRSEGRGRLIELEVIAFRTYN